MPSSKKVRHVQSDQPKQSKRGKKGAGQSMAAAPVQQSGGDSLHRPVKVEEVSTPPLRSRVDRVLPPFSVQRYLAIWVLGMIPLVGIILLLARPWDTASRQEGQGTPT